jgi:hypothetical protein
MCLTYDYGNIVVLASLLKCVDWMKTCAILGSNPKMFFQFVERFNFPIKIFLYEKI